jgi:hypothetical protein
MTWKEKTIVKILLIIVMMLADDTQSELGKALRDLSNHIAVSRKEDI